MLTEVDKGEFSRLIRTTMMVCGGSAPERDVMRAWWSVLSFSDMPTLRAAFGEYIGRGKYPPKPADIVEIIERLQPDGRPSAEEAWAMIPKDETASAVITEEMAEAYGIALPLLQDGDRIAARMAFKDAYNRIVEANKLRGVAVQWFPSLGSHVGGRELVLREAERLGRLPASHVSGLLPPPPAAPAMLAALSLAAEVGNRVTPEVARARIAELRKALGGAA